MNKIIELLDASKACLEHPVYHPEKWLNNHIALVALKCHLLYNNINLTATALLHDIMKPHDGNWKETDNGLYWSNNDHAKQAAELIRENDDIRYYLKSLKGLDINIVADICYYHMASKDKIPKKAKRIPLIDKFIPLDDMVNRHPFPVRTRDICFPDHGTFLGSKISFIGQSPIQIENKKSEFTIAVNRFPYRYNFTDIPLFFKGHEFEEIIKSLFNT